MSDESGQWVTIEQRGRVGWFDLRQLSHTAWMALTSTVVGSLTGRREVLAALDISRRGADPSPYPYHESEDNNPVDDLWIDYIADTGDGFNATHTVSWLAARDWLFLGDQGQKIRQPFMNDALTEAPRDAIECQFKLPRADVLIFGGDEVYPAASAGEYKARLHDPFYAARPWGSGHSVYNPVDAARDVYAIPGNHDWYDGLTSFIRVFCQPNDPRWIGTWRPRQHRSYFSLRLPHGHWLWGVDMALGEDLDAPQSDYFRMQARDLGEQDRVILCVPSPAWLEFDERIEAKQLDTSMWSRLNQLIKLVTDQGADVPLMIAGDLHHYVRHTADSGRTFITCGGGGAFTLGTDGQPETLRMPDGDRATLEKEHRFPSESDSHKLKRRALLMFWSSKGFCILLATLQILVIWSMQKSSQLLLSYQQSGLPYGDIDMTWLDRLAATSRNPLHVWQLVSDAFTITVRSPSVIILVAALAGIFGAVAVSGKRRGDSPLPVLASGIVHLGVQIGLAWLVAALLKRLLETIGLEDLAMSISMALLLFATLWFVCGLVFGIYLWLTNRFLNVHQQEVYSCQAIEQFKSFLRLHVSAEGLRVFPIGIKNCVRDWELADGIDENTAASGARQVMRSAMLDRSRKLRVPDGATHVFLPPVEGIAPELIEDPIFIPRNGQSGEN